MKYTYTIDELRQAVASSTSMRQVLITLGIGAQGSNYQTVKNRIEKHGIDTSHLTGQAWAAGQRFMPKRPTSDYLSNSYPINSDRLRRRLLDDGIFQHECSQCHNTTWNEQPIPLELDHIDGNNINNELTNLRLLCPNCHAQTKTYCRRKK